MKIVILSFLFLFTKFNTFSQNETAFIGKWKNEEDTKRVIEIYLAKDGFYYGKGVGETNKNIKAGHLIFRKCKYDSNSKSLKGTMHPPDKLVEMNVNIQLEKDGKLKVVAKKLFMTKTLVFIKVNE
jgi:hypothetical protein